MPTKKSRGEYEDEFTKAIIKFEKEQLGRGPDSARTYMLDDLILVRLRGLLTTAETALVRDREGQALVKEVRRQLHEISRPLMENIVKEILGYEVVSLHTDMSAKTGERIIVLVVDRSLDEMFD